MVASASAQDPTYNAAADWLSTYGNTAAVVASNHASWGAGNVWSAGELSYNWTNQEAIVGGSSLQQLTTYYNANTTGNETSGATIKATFTYTVPFQAYQFNPGVTFQQMVGQTLTEQIASGFRPEKAGGSDSSAITLPSGITSGGAASGYLQEIGAAKTDTGQANVAGFSTTADNASNKFSDGDGSVQASTAAVFYNYGANITSTSLGSFELPSGSNGVLAMGLNFGPTYVAWTAPSAGTVTSINTTMTDLGVSNPSDGDPGFYVITSTLGPAAPIMQASQFVATGGAGAQYTLGNMQSQYSSTIAGSSFSTATASWASAYSAEGALSLQWVSGSFAVTAGEVIYFVADAGHNQIQTHGNHSAGTSTDGMALNAVVNFVPEPSSVVLFGLAGVGLALTAWKRRRVA
jgi:hypothetical protein